MRRNARNVRNALLIIDIVSISLELLRFYLFSGTVISTFLFKIVKHPAWK